MNQTPDDLTLLRLAVQNLACAPQAQRRYVQLGLLDRAIANLDRIGADLTPLVEAGRLDAEQARQVADLRREVLEQGQADPEFVPRSIAAPREFLFSEAMETEGWEAVRRRARPCHSALAGPDSPFMALRAK